jgi:hypothetical protein
MAKKGQGTESKRGGEEQCFGVAPGSPGGRGSDDVHPSHSLGVFLLF